MPTNQPGGTSFHFGSQASCDIAFRVAREKGTIVAGGIVQTAVFKHVKVFKGKPFLNSTHQDKPEGKAEVQKELEEGLEVLIQNNIDLIIVEVFTTTFLLFISSHAVHSKVIDF